MTDNVSNQSTGGLAGLIRQGVTNYMKDVHTALPGMIVEFDPISQTAKVQLLLRRIFKGDNALDLPQLINVPVWQPRAGGFVITFPIKPEDECLVLFSERSLDNWFKQSGVQTPTDFRMHSLSDAICLVGMSSEPKVITSYDTENFQIRNEDNDQSVTLLANKDIKLTSPTKVIIDTPLAEFTTDVKINNNLEVIGDTSLSSTVTSNGKDISDTHTHGKGDYKDAENRPLLSGSSSVPD